MSRQFRVLWLVTVLSACTSFQLQVPDALPPPTRVTVIGNPSVSGVTVTVDGADVSGQMAYSATNTSEGNLTLAAGNHTFVATGDVSCWYCVGGKYRMTDTKAACVALASIPAVVTTKIPSAKGDNRSWADLGGANPSLAPDSGTKTTRWRFLSLGTGVGSTIGVIESVAAFSCKCLRSPNDSRDSEIAFATCDVNDVRQQWIGVQQQMSGGKGFYRFENRSLQQGGYNFGCLAEASGNRVTQSECVDQDDRLWALFNNAIGMFESGSAAAWGQ